mmetsp:Transcript_114937/g.245405  ORF Transcript_114937/g.245405 Transcript_114937/m.245405 type:complete len:689 (-) Transcript_114937:74-2140(-)
MVLLSLSTEDEGRPLLQMWDWLRNGAQDRGRQCAPGGSGRGEATVRVLAAVDHDGVCSAKLLLDLLRREGVKHVVVPVSNNNDILVQFRQLEGDFEVRSLVLLNCGVGLDLQQHLEDCGASPELRCFVIDAHRPILLANCSARSNRVVILNDDPIAEANDIQPPVEEWEADDDIGDESETGGNDSEVEQENEWDPNAGAGGDPRPPGERAAERREKKRRRQADRQAKIERKRRKVNEYYETSYYATPATMSLFKMAAQANAPSQDLLWLAAVSLVGYHDQGLLSEVNYNRLAWEQLKEALDRSTDHALSSSAPSQGTQGATATVPDSSPGPSDDEQETVPKSRARRPLPRAAMARQCLRFENDLRLSLYKHWTLEESIMHSSYFYGTLELHRDKGLRALKAFFATAGIHPSDYRQLFSCMQIDVRKAIQKKFRDHGKGYGLTEKNMFLQQFVRDLGPLGDKNPALFLQQLSSMDAVHIVGALLSSVPPALSGARIEQLPQTADGRRDTAAISEMESHAMVENFWRAFDAVLCKEPKALLEGIGEAQEMAKSVQNLARLIKDTKAMHQSRHFRWCKIEQPPHLFRNHLAVRRLAVWLLQVLFEYRPKGEDRGLPLLVIMRDPVMDAYLCVGATPTRVSDQDEFGSLFRGVMRADKSIKARYDFFDKSCIEVSADDFERFWELLVDTPVG